MSHICWYNASQKHSDHLKTPNKGLKSAEWKMSKRQPDLEKTPNRCLKSNVAVVCQGSAVQLVPSRDEPLSLKETELGLQQRQNALISALQIIHCQAPGCPARGHVRSGFIAV